MSTARVVFTELSGGDASESQKRWAKQNADFQARLDAFFDGPEIKDEPVIEKIIGPLKFRIETDKDWFRDHQWDIRVVTLKDKSDRVGYRMYIFNSNSELVLSERLGSFAISKKEREIFQDVFKTDSLKDIQIALLSIVNNRLIDVAKDVRTKGCVVTLGRIVHDAEIIKGYTDGIIANSVTQKLSDAHISSTATLVAKV